MATYNPNFYTGSATIDSGGSQGRVMAMLISHDQATVQTVTIHDNTSASGTILLTIHVAPEQSPWFANFSQVIGDKKSGLPWNTGLTITPGNCEVTLWTLTY